MLRPYNPPAKHVVLSRTEAINQCANKALCSLQHDLNTGAVTLTEEIKKRIACIPNNCAYTYDSQVNIRVIPNGHAKTLNRNEPSSIQRRIQNTVRDDASRVASVKGVLAASYETHRWTNATDRHVASMSTTTHPYSYNNTMAPGYQTPGGHGVDIKHNSYDRRLNKLKGGVFRAKQPFLPTPVQGNKTHATLLFPIQASCC
jgi:hypothetical protein